MKALKAEALELARDAKTAMRVSKILLETWEKARELGQDKPMN